MIYLTEGTNIIPRVSSIEATKVIFTNQVTKKEISYDIQVSMNNLWYVFYIGAAFPDGQYDYALYDTEGSLVGSGIAQAGEFQVKKNNYSTDINIKTYNR